MYCYFPHILFQMSIIEEFNVPVRMDMIKGQSADDSSVEKKLQLLMTIVQRVGELNNVIVKTIPYRTKSGDVFQVPGAWCISGKSSFAKEDDDEGDNTPATHSTTEDEEDDTDDESDFPLAGRSTSSSDRFVVRNEFGHARIQHFIRFLEMNGDRSLSYGSSEGNGNGNGTEVGGHCVLPPAVFDICLARQWGWKHPFGGQYHPITGTIIPANTLLFPAPRNEEEVEIVWKLIQTSYAWALDNNNQQDSPKE